MSATVRFRPSRKWLTPQQVQGFALGTLLALPLTAPAVMLEESVAGPADIFAKFPVIGREEMAQLRGGFSFSGLELEFGANVRTLIDDVVRLETIIQFTKAGIVSSTMELAQAAANANTARGSLSRVAQDTASLVEDIANRAVNGNQASAGQSSSTAVAAAGNARAVADSRGQGGGASIDLAGKLSGLRNFANQIRGNAASAENPAANGAQTQPGRSGAMAGSRVSRLGSDGAQIDLSGLGDNIRGVVLNDTKGLTAAIQELTRDRISSTVINRADNRRIEIQLDVQVDVKNFSQYSASLRNILLNQRLSSRDPAL